jgi:RND family efflux transporter MFP subunit
LLAAVLTLWVALGSGCGSREGAEADEDSTAVDLGAAGGSMESDAENVGQAAGQETGEAEEETKRETSTSVDASAALRADLVKPVVAEGSIRARHAAELRAEIGGKVTAVRAVEGQDVRRGQLIAKIDDREYEVAAEEARSDYLQALSLLAIEEDDVSYQEMAEEMRDEFSDLERLEHEGKISREERMAREVELDVEALKAGKFRIEVAAARSGVARARAALERARLNLEHTEIRAPFDGVLTGLTLSAGQLLSINEVVCSVVDNVNIEAEVGVLEADLGYVEVGRHALLAVPALRDTIVTQVHVVSPQFDRNTRTCQVLLRVTDESGRIRPGMFVRAIIAGQTYTERLLVPREAVLTREGRPLLFKVEGDRAKWLYVELGESNDHMVEITKVVQGGTLDPGDKVVVSDHLTLAHDAKIKVKKTVASADPWISLDSENE